MAKDKLSKQPDHVRFPMLFSSGPDDPQGPQKEALRGAILGGLFSGPRHKGSRDERGTGSSKGGAHKAQKSGWLW